jgi:hypothetical protein
MSELVVISFATRLHTAGYHLMMTATYSYTLQDAVAVLQKC